MIATNQKTHRQDAHLYGEEYKYGQVTLLEAGLTYWMKKAPMSRPSTLPTAPQPPKMPIARACSAGSGKMPTSKVSADGIVRAATVCIPSVYC
jgi:hypothetical protein